MRRLYLSPLRCRIAPLSPRSCRLVVAPRHSIDPSRCCAVGGRVSTWAVAVGRAPPPLSSHPLSHVCIRRSPTTLSRPPSPPCWAQTYPVVGYGGPIRTWPSIRFIHICFLRILRGYVSTAYAIRICTGYVSRTYPQAERCIRAAQANTLWGTESLESVRD
jgi:hypothetical protein